MFYQELPLLGDSSPKESVFMLDVIRRAKKFLLGTALVLVFTATDIAVATGFFEVRVASLLLCCLRLRNSWKPCS